MDFGTRLKKLRKEKNISQEDFANKIGVTRSSVGNYETNQNMPSTEILNNIATVLNCSVDHLLGKDIDSNKIPVLGIIKAGYNYLANENIVGYVNVNDKSLICDDFFALKVKGNSMEPIIYEDDIAIIKKQNDFENGDIVAAIIDGQEATLKKAYKNDNGLILQPFNNSIDPLILDKNDIIKKPVIIIGVVYNITRSFK